MLFFVIFEMFDKWVIWWAEYLNANYFIGLLFNAGPSWLSNHFGDKSRVFLTSSIHGGALLSDLHI